MEIVQNEDIELIKDAVNSAIKYYNNNMSFSNTNYFNCVCYNCSRYITVYQESAGYELYMVQTDSDSPKHFRLSINVDFYDFETGSPENVDFSKEAYKQMIMFIRQYHKKYPEISITSPSEAQLLYLKSIIG